MKLYLIRHGKTEATRLHVYCGSTDLPLSLEGKKALEGRSYPKAERYYTSGMKRTNETMEILYPGQTYEKIEDLREIDFGVFEMKSYEELKDLPVYQQWILGNNIENVCPGGESGAMASLRAKKALETLISRDQRDLAVVTHGGIIAGIMESWFPEEGKNRYEWQPKPGDAYEITIERSKENEDNEKGGWTLHWKSLAVD